jgi:hypothetical protein
MHVIETVRVMIMKKPSGLAAERRVLALVLRGGNRRQMTT